MDFHCCFEELWVLTTSLLFLHFADSAFVIFLQPVTTLHLSIEIAGLSFHKAHATELRRKCFAETLLPIIVLIVDNHLILLFVMRKENTFIIELQLCKILKVNPIE
jgi:hypothetical protein